jgi:hypothetical protein
VSFNPYAPPQENPASPLDPGGGSPSGVPQEWTIEEVLRLAWDAMKLHWPALVFGPLIAGIIGGIPGQIIQAAGRVSHDRDVVLGTTIVGALTGMIIQPFFQGGLVRLQLQAVRGGSPALGEIFTGGSTYLRLLATNFLLFLAVFAGSLALIVPGVILALGLGMSQFYVVDQNMGPIEAMSASWNAMKGHKAHFLGFLLVSFLVALVGLAACCVGVIVAQAVIYVATAAIYTRVSGRTGAWHSAPPSPYGAAYGPPGGGSAGPGPTPPPGGGWGAA